MTDPDQYDGFASFEELNLSPQEIEDLRNNKRKLADYGMKKIRELMKNQEPYPDEMFEEAARREAEKKRPFYRFFVVDYFATCEGKSYWLKICRNYQKVDDRDREKEQFVKFIGIDADHYMHGFEELTEEEFMKRYDTLVPHNVKMMLQRRDQPAFTWETHYHFNYS